jgi:hypothetical protein
LPTEFGHDQLDASNGISQRDLAPIGPESNKAVKPLCCRQLDRLKGVTGRYTLVALVVTG